MKAAPIAGDTMFRLPHRRIPCEPNSQVSHNGHIRLKFIQDRPLDLYVMDDWCDGRAVNFTENY